ncbi:hypothetical protein [uncultured Chryseobacterium sp.]|mgnify:CR=1 FL=1|uniref:hypothetical protein n=1 Tax=uncultured Chryseobacterium sp. TaxID=259322 RepID=UPI002620984D|nr:hypothetical protein [uncultured Chryseobacterium sp.]
MIQITLSVVFIIFGLFLKKTDNSGFRSSKRFAMMFIILGGAVLVSKLVSYFLHPA